MKELNRMCMEFPAKSCNEGFARSVVAAFATQIDPRFDELSDLRTAVSEGVTNAIVHAYSDQTGERQLVRLECVLYPDTIEITITDFGKGIEDVQQAREPLYTTAPEMERSGMGFTIMETFTDDMFVESKPGQGTKVFLRKVFSVHK
ncbi:MAG: anti-sigma F factor [Clostridia bacterium]|nr:anti-sigma F factor [Clostridia bacterium]